MSIKIYLDTCCLNRPFDNQTQERIRLESEAVLTIIGRVEKGEWELVGSEVLIDEIEQIPDPQRLIRIKLLLNLIHQTIKIGEKEIKRAKELQKAGFHAFDSLHIACAESGEADVFLTTDDHLLKLTKKTSMKLKIRVDNPLVWVEEALR